MPNGVPVPTNKGREADLRRLEVHAGGVLSLSKHGLRDLVAAISIAGLNSYQIS